MIIFEHIPIHAENTESGQKVPYLEIDGEVKPIDFLFSLDDKHGIIAGGNLQTLRGAPKSGKSAAGLILMTAALKGEFLGIKAKRENLNLLWIDTEQDEDTLRLKARAVLDMAGLDTQPENLKVVTLRGYTPKEALALTQQAAKENAPDFIFLDGVADLCRDFNEQNEVTNLVSEIDKIAKEYRSAITCLIHTNKKDDNSKGHLGSFMQQKGAETYQVDKRTGENIANITTIYTRFGDRPPFPFAFADDFKITAAADALEKAKDEAQERTRSTFAALFKDTKRLTKGELIKAYTSAQGCQESKAEKDIRDAANAQILCKNKEGRNVFYTYLFPAILEEDEDII